MAIVHYAIWGHGGAGIEEMKKKFDLPKNIYVAFYVPPGRMSGTAYSTAVFDALKANYSRLSTLAKIDQWFVDVRKAIRSKPIEGNTKASSLKLYTDLDFKEWPRLVGEGYASTDYLLNYALFGDGDLGIYRLSSGVKKAFANDSSLEGEVKEISQNHPDSNNETVVIHVISCREEALLDETSTNPSDAERQQIRLKHNTTLPGIPN